MKATDQQWLHHHSCHDYDLLTARWKHLAQKTGLEIVVLANQSGYEIFALRGVGKVQGGGLYLSAGVHGDEPATVWALLQWAEANQERLAGESIIILPCVNPWGLVNNLRWDEQGRDLNRMFQNESLPFFLSWRKLLGKQQFLLTLNLHEDYDAQGIYVYELAPPDVNVSDQVFTRIESIIPRESREEVEGRPVRAGMVHRSKDLRRVVEEELEGGYPEAIYLYLNHTRLALTFETPSEFAFHERVQAQVGFIEGVMTI